MIKSYLLASGLAMLRHSLSGLGSGFLVVGSYVEHALLQVCEDINNDRAKRVEEAPKLKLDPEDLN